MNAGICIFKVDFMPSMGPNAGLKVVTQIKTSAEIDSHP